MTEIKGVRIGVAEAGLKKPNKKDIVYLWVIVKALSERGVFTQKCFCAAPVVFVQKHLGLAGSR